MLLDSVVRALISPVLWWIFINGWDEFFVDAAFVYLTLSGRQRDPFPPEDLNGIVERRLAVFIPLWREHAVIEEMVNHNIAAIDYGDYDIFLGAYRNDPRTQEKVMALEERYPFVHLAICPADGPTSKADCLNWIYQRMLLEEQARNVRYEVIVQHDAEDIVHPKAFRLINALAREYDMIQVPVFPLRTPFRNFTHGTYCDEFAEWQLKDLPTRQLLGGFVPSAGVGTAYRREALEEIAARYKNQIFNVDILTEDYEIGLKFKLHNKRQVLALQQAPSRNGNGCRRTNGKGNGKAGLGANGTGNGNANNRRNGRAANGNSSGQDGNQRGAEYIATREYFPRAFYQAVRQKSRWIMGVSLQAWEQWGWAGGPRQIYWFWRDRKGLAGNIASLVCNLAFVYCAVMWLAAALFHTGWGLTRVFPPQDYIWILLAFNTMFLVERVGFRFYSTNKIYGLRHAAGVLLRMPWANLINFCSTAAAGFNYLRARLLRRRPAWAKTAHVFPDREQLISFKRPLGEVLLTLHLVDAGQLEAALAEQQQEAADLRLGEILLRRGHLAESGLIRALGVQQAIEVCELEPGSIEPALLDLVPCWLAERHEVLPVGFRNGGRLLVAGPELLSDEAMEELKRSTGFVIQPALTTRHNWRQAMEAAYAPASLASARPTAGQLALPIVDTLLRGGLCLDSVLRAALGAAGFEFRRVTSHDVSPDAAAVVPRQLQRELAAVPLELRENEVVIAVARILAEHDRIRLQQACRLPVRLVYTLRSDLQALLDN